MIKANAKPQKEEEVTKAPKIKKEWSEIDFAEMDAWQIEQLHRAIGDQVQGEIQFSVGWD